MPSIKDCNKLLNTLVKISNSEVPMREMQVLLAIKTGTDWSTGITSRINASNGVGKSHCVRLEERGLLLQKEKTTGSRRKPYVLTEKGNAVINDLFKPKKPKR